MKCLKHRVWEATELSVWKDVTLVLRGLGNEYKDYYLARRHLVGTVGEVVGDANRIMLEAMRRRF